MQRSGVRGLAVLQKHSGRGADTLVCAHAYTHAPHPFPARSQRRR